MTGLPVSDGAAAYLAGFADGIRPDPELWVDEWADAHARIPRENGAEPGKYHTDRTPYAREVMRCLSPGHPARRVVAMVASQLFKTQVGLNWIGASICQAPANTLVLLPSLGLARRVSARIGRTVAETPPLRERVAAPRSRNSQNTVDAKEFPGGTLFIATAGSASNLAEVPARYIYGDEVDRWDVNVDGEGDPIELAETRTSTYGRNAKLYFTSTPTIEDASRIAELYRVSDQRRYYVPCPHCGHLQTLVWERVRWESDFSAAQYICAECGALIDEHYKGEMLARGEWRAEAAGDGETVGFQLSALYAPPGWISWSALAKQYAKAKAAIDRGDPEGMQVFFNTRLALTWDNAQERTAPAELKARAEDYPLRTVPAGALALTAAVDVQSNRLELMIIGWGAGLERWVVDYQVLFGDPADGKTWRMLEEQLTTKLRHASGQELSIRAVCIDSGGHHTQEVYEFCRARRSRGVLAVKGASRPGRPVIASRPSKVDVNRRGRLERFGAELWIIGTDTAKDWLANRMQLETGPGALHFSRDLPDDFYEQLTAERRLVRYVKGHRRTEWVKAKAARNEALDLSVYNLAAAYFLGLHRMRDADWEKLQLRVNPPTKDLFVTAAKAPAPETPAHEALPEPPAPSPQPQQRRRPARRGGGGTGFGSDDWVL